MTQKRIVLCLDGTWNSPYDEQERADGSKVLRPSNTLKLARAVCPQSKDNLEQLVYYDIGVGSLAIYPGFANRLLYRADRMLGGGFAAGFEGNVEDALSFLAMNYQPGDQVYVFGFSRGAATARAVTRFLAWNRGVPQKADVYYLPRLFRTYVVSRGEPAAYEREIEKINTEGRQQQKLLPFHWVDITYLGVWDTVAALGSLVHMLKADPNNAKRSFHIGTSPAICVRNTRHAIAVDEKRLDFRPEIWREPADPDQKMEQRWFAGVHSNVGGGYLTDGLANIAFHWILDGAKALGLEIDEKFISHFKGVHFGTRYESQTRMYKTLETMRGRRNKGVRKLTGYPLSANLDLHPSVIKRMLMEEEEYQPAGKNSKVVKQRYRPENVIEFLAAQPSVPAYLASLGIADPLPDDLEQRIAQLQSARPGSAPIPA